MQAYINHSHFINLIFTQIHNNYNEKGLLLSITLMCGGWSTGKPFLVLYLLYFLFKSFLYFLPEYSYADVRITSSALIKANLNLGFPALIVTITVGSEINF